MNGFVILSKYSIKFKLFYLSLKQFFTIFALFSEFRYDAKRSCCDSDGGILIHYSPPRPKKHRRYVHDDG